MKDGVSLRSGDGRVTSDGRGLRLESLAAVDAGIYQCRAQGHQDSALGTALVMLGDTLPMLKYRFIEQSLQPGPAVSLKCVAQGTPTPAVSWLLDGFPLQHSPRLVVGQFVNMEGDVISHVNISSVSVRDGGLYRCTAANSVGNTRHQARLNVYGVPMVRPMGEVTAVAGEQFIITCPVGGWPINMIQWQKGGKKLPLSRRQTVSVNGSLVINNVQRAIDEGDYSCTASARHSHTSTQPVTIRVL
ncbi:unnamed protein product, partial [Meganyctiphanes norvegica]